MRPPAPLRDGLLLALLVLPVAFGQPTFKSASGSPQPDGSVQFTATFDDTAGWFDILNAQVYVSKVGGWPAPPACNVGYYNFLIDFGLYLLDDNNTTLLGPIFPGSGQLSNSQCKVSAFVVQTQSDNRLIYQFNVAFTTALRGNNDLWGSADNLVGAYSPWTVGGTWDLPTNVTITSAPPGIPITIDGTSDSTPYTFQRDVGTSRTLSAPSTSPGSSGTQYQFGSWSDQGAQTHTITVPIADTTYTATYLTQFYLATAVSPSGAGSVSPGGWYSSGAQATVTASPAAGYQFAGFSGSLSGTTSPQTVTMTAPAAVTANFSQVLPTATGITPSAASSIAGQPQSFTATFSDAAGAGDIQNTQVYVSSDPNNPLPPACNVGYYDFISGEAGMYLTSDPDSSGNTSLLGPIWPGSGSLSNSSCSVSNFSYSWSGTQLTVNFTATPTLAFAGQKSVWASALTWENASAPWQQVGAWTISQPGPPDLTIAKSHFGNFALGQTGATYAITASNIGGMPTSGVVTVTDTVPAGLTATAIAGSGWTCTLSSVSCNRTDSLSSGGSYPSITLTVTVANNAPASVTNTATVAGGGESNTTNDTATDVTTITVGTPDLTIAKNHSGMFVQGQVGAIYFLTASNVGTGLTTGTVTVTDTVPAGLTPTAISGTGWNCTLSSTPSCTRSDSLAPGGSYPPITLTVTVATTAPASVTNTATVAGGGETNTTNDTATDVTAILPAGTQSSGPTGMSIWGPSDGGSYFNAWTRQALYTLGLKFRSDAAGTITGIRFYTTLSYITVFLPPWTTEPCGANGSPSTNTVMLYDVNGNLLAQASAGYVGYGGGPQWIQANFTTPVPISANTTYVAAYATSCGYYQDTGYFTNSGVDNPPLHALRSGVDGVNGVYATGNAFPTTGAGDSNFWVDVVFVSPPALDHFTLPPNNTTYTPDGPGYISPNKASLSTAATQSQNFSFVFTDVGGAGDIQTAQLYVGYGGNWPNNVQPYCIFSYLNKGTATQVLPAASLANPGGDTLYMCPTSGPCGKPGSPTSQSASACTISNFSSSISGSQNSQLTVNMTVSLSSAYALGTPTIWYYTTSLEGLVQGWYQIGTWNIPTPDLTISNTSAATFTQGQIGAQYTITVTNNGGAPTSGVVTVADTLPTGLTATALSGQGWSCALVGLWCSRSDALAQGSSYDPITLKVNVASNAPGSVTNAALVSGGGDLNTGNNAAADQTTIVPPAASFTVSLGSGPATVLAGQSAAYTLAVAGVGGFAGTVNFTPIGVPPGASTTFDPPSLVGSGQTTMTIATMPRASGGLLGSYRITVTASSTGYSSQTAVVALAVQDFVLTVSPAAQTVLCTGSATYQIQAAGLNGFNAPLDNLSGIQWYIASQPASAPGTVSASVSSGVGLLTVSTSQPSTCNPMLYTINLSGTAAGFTRSATVELDLNLNTGNPPGFSLEVDALQSSTQAGQPAGYSVLLTPKYAFGGSVNLSVTGLPSGAVWSVGQNPLLVTSTAVASTLLTVTTSPTTPSGSFTVTATAASGSPPASQSMAASLSIGPDFVLPPAQPVTIDVSSSGTTTQYITSVNGFTAQVNLSYDPSTWPPGLSATFGPNSVSPSGSTTVTVTADSSVPDGSYNLPFTATGGGVAHGGTLGINKHEPPNQLQNGVTGSCQVPDDGTLTACGFHLLWGESRNVGCHLSAGGANVAGTTVDSSVNLTISFIASPPDGSQALDCTYNDVEMPPLAGAVLVYPGAPHITSVQPCNPDQCGFPPTTITPGTEITVIGYNFGQGGTLKLCQLDATRCSVAPYDSWNSDGTQVTASISQPPGAYAVQVESNAPQGYGFLSSTDPSAIDSNMWEVDVEAGSCAVPVNFTQAGTGQDEGANATWDGMTAVILKFNYTFQSSSNNPEDLRSCEIGERVVEPGTRLTYTYPSPPFPSNPDTTVPNPTIANYNPADILENFQGLADNHIMPGAFVPPYSSGANFKTPQIYRYHCPCANGNNWVTIAGPLTINHAITPNGDGTWRYAVCKDNIPSPGQPPSSSCANKNPLPQ